MRCLFERSGSICCCPLLRFLREQTGPKIESTFGDPSNKRSSSNSLNFITTFIHHSRQPQDFSSRSQYFGRLSLTSSSSTSTAPSASTTLSQQRPSPASLLVISSSSSMFHASSTRLNAAGLAPEHSKLLPERQPKDDEAHLLQLLHQVSLPPFCQASASTSRDSVLTV